MKVVVVIYIYYRKGNKAAENAWNEFIEEVSDIVTILRSNTRIMMGKW